MPPLNEEAQKRLDGFTKEYGELVKKYNFDYVTYPVWVPSTSGRFETVIQTSPVDLTTQKEADGFVAK